MIACPAWSPCPGCGLESGVVLLCSREILRPFLRSITLHCPSFLPVKAPIFPETVRDLATVQSNHPAFLGVHFTNFELLALADEAVIKKFIQIGIDRNFFDPKQKSSCLLQAGTDVLIKAHPPLEGLHNF